MRSEGRSLPWAVAKAGCIPQLKRMGMKESPCSPPRLEGSSESCPSRPPTHTGMVPRRSGVQMATTCRLLGLWRDPPTSHCEELNRRRPPHRLTRSLPFVLICQTLENVGHTLATRLSGESVLARGCHNFHSPCHLFGHRPGDQSSEDVSNHDPPACLRLTSSKQ